MRKVLIAAFVAVLAGRVASATTINFDSLIPGTYTEEQFGELFGLVFDNTGAGNSTFVVQAPSLFGFELGPGFTGPNAVLNSPVAVSRTRVFFPTPVSFAGVTLGDFASDADVLHLVAYGALDVVLAQDSFENPLDSTAGHTLSLAAPDIQWIEFWGEGMNGYNSVYWDNLAYEPAAAIPEPSTTSLLGGATLALLLVQRRGRRLRGGS